jgi:hypothetical protein
MRGLTIPGRVNISPAGQYETGYRIENGRGGVVSAQRRNYKWYKPCTFEGSYVSGG